MLQLRVVGARALMGEACPPSSVSCTAGGLAGGVVGLHSSSHGPREGACHGEAPVREARAGDACRRCVSEVWLCVRTCSFAATAKCPLLSERPSDGEPWAHMPATRLRLARGDAEGAWPWPQGVEW